MKTTETLRPRESFQSVDAREASGGAHVNIARAEAMHAMRGAMLEGIASEIGSTLYEALAQKIDHERAELLGIIEREATITETKRRLDKVLKSEYFSYRRLDTNVL